MIHCGIDCAERHHGIALVDDTGQLQPSPLWPAPSRTATWNREQNSNQLRCLLREYHGSALDAFAAWQKGLCRPEARELLRLAPTPSRAARLSRTQIQAALKRAGRKRDIEAEADRIPRGLPRRVGPPADAGRSRAR